ncbi:hypothetical protein [Bradyrhizobium manausense]|nr:hypothetical protein [Bradyrhizobium manausense]
MLRDFRYENAAAIAGPADLPSAVRLNAMARYLGILVGPAVGGVIC